jgi:hypothetical protein
MVKGVRHVQPLLALTQLKTLTVQLGPLAHPAWSRCVGVAGLDSVDFFDSNCYPRAAANTAAAAARPSNGV